MDPVDGITEVDVQRGRTKEEDPVVSVVLDMRRSPNDVVERFKVVDGTAFYVESIERRSAVEAEVSGPRGESVREVLTDRRVDEVVDRGGDCIGRMEVNLSGIDE